jgi:hypothetical protein
MSTEALENLVKVADVASSRQLVSDVVRAAYALGKFDAVIEQTLAEVNARRRELDRGREVLS